MSAYNITELNGYGWGMKVLHISICIALQKPSLVLWFYARKGTYGTDREFNGTPHYAGNTTPDVKSISEF